VGLFKLAVVELWVVVWSRGAVVVVVVTACGDGDGGGRDVWVVVMVCGRGGHDVGGGCGMWWRVVMVTWWCRCSVWWSSWSWSRSQHVVVAAWAGIVVSNDK